MQIRFSNSRSTSPVYDAYPDFKAVVAVNGSSEQQVFFTKRSGIIKQIWVLVPGCCRGEVVSLFYSGDVTDSPLAQSDFSTDFPVAMELLFDPQGQLTISA